MEVGLGPGHILLWGLSSPPQKGCTAPNFVPSVVAIQLDGSRYHSVRTLRRYRLRPGAHCVTWRLETQLPVHLSYRWLALVGTIVLRDRKWLPPAQIHACC